MYRHIKYFYKKILILIKILVLKRSHKTAGIFFPQTYNNLKTIIFDLSDPHYSHVGDCLFYEPFLRLFKKNNIKVSVIPTKSMEEYFFKLGYKIECRDNIKNYKNLVTPIWRYYDIEKNLRKKTLFIYYNDTRISSPVTSYIGKEIAKKYSFGAENDLFFKSVIPSSKESLIKLKDNNKYYVLSEYVDSGYIRVNKKMTRELINFARNKYDSGYKIIHVGTSKDKLKSKVKIPFPTYDMRGKTSIIDLFKIFSEVNVVGSISFDTAIAHISMLNNKKTHIKMRIFKKSYTNFIKKYVFPYYRSDKKIKVDYI